MKTIIILLIGYGFVFSQSNLGYKWKVNENGHINEIWESSDKENIYKGEYYDNKGNKISTINEIKTDDKNFTIQRIYSSNGEFCTINCRMDESGKTLRGYCFYPLTNRTNRWEADILTDDNDTLNLSGVWKCNDNGTYYIRQSGDSVIWYGEQNKEIKEFTNVAYGKISDSSIYLTWYDVPKGKILGHGTIALSIITKNKLKRLKVTGDFGGSEWERIK